MGSQTGLITEARPNAGENDIMQCVKCFYRGKRVFAANAVFVFYHCVVVEFMCLCCAMEGSEKSQKHALPFSAMDVYPRAGMDTEYVRLPVNPTASYWVKILS